MSALRKKNQFIKRLALTLFALTLLLAGLAALVTRPVQTLPYTLNPTFKDYQALLTSFKNAQKNRREQYSYKFEAGWAQLSILPPFKTPIAGYKPRSEFESILDTPCVKVLVLRLATKKMAFVSLDLLLVPPNIYQLLRQELKQSNWTQNELYMGATHTHSGMGGWASGLLGHFAAGSYQPELPLFVAKKIAETLKIAEANCQVADLFMAESDEPAYLNNRISQKSNEVFGVMHLLECVQKDGKKAIWAVYGAHATCMSSRSTALCGDYPTAFCKQLQKNENADLVAFMAGAVGSQNPTEFGKKDQVLIDFLGKELAKRANETLNKKKSVKTPRLALQKLPLKNLKQTMRLSQNWELNTWFFEAFLYAQQPFMQVLTLGDWCWLSYPADFSGVLAAQLQANLPPSAPKRVFTSFNGAYVGYVVPDHYLIRYNRHETREMNWAGANTGSLWYWLSYEILLERHHN